MDHYSISGIWLYHIDFKILIIRNNTVHLVTNVHVEKIVVRIFEVYNVKSWKLGYIVLKLWSVWSTMCSMPETGETSHYHTTLKT